MLIAIGLSQVVPETGKPIIDCQLMEKLAQTNKPISVDNVAKNWQAK